MKTSLKLIVLTLFFVLTSPAFAQPDVLISKGDTLKVYVVDHRGTDLIQGSFAQGPMSARDPHDVVVSAEGRIYLPNIGVFHVVDRTPYEIEQLIRQKVNKAIRLRDVAVLLTNIQQNKVYVLGEVINPGMINLDPTKPFEMKLMNVVGLAGGFTDRADKREIKIVSYAGESRTVNVQQMIKEGSSDANVTLLNRDTVIVSQTVSRVYVLGHVRNPGAFPFIETANFDDYIGEAGGLLSGAGQDNIGIFRKQAPKSMLYRVSLNDGYIAKSKKQVTIKEGDIIYIPKTFWADLSEIASIFGIARDGLYIYDTLQTYEIN